MVSAGERVSEEGAGVGVEEGTERRYVRTMQPLSPEEIHRLSPEERLVLIGQLWDSLHDGEVSVPPAQRAELSRRLSIFDKDRAEAVTWEQLRDELERRKENLAHRRP